MKIEIELSEISSSYLDDLAKEFGKKEADKIRAKNQKYLKTKNGW